VYAPFTWPKSSVSRSDSASAPQFRVTSGLLRRGLRACSARATSSFPRPGLALHEHGGGAVCDRLHEPADLADRRRAAHEAVGRAAARVELLLEHARPVEQPLPLRGLRDGADDHVHVVERLREVVVGPRLQRRERGLHRGVAGHHHRLHLGAALLEEREQLEAGELRHLHVEQRDVEVLLHEPLRGGGRGLERDDVAPGAAQEQLERAEQRELVVHDEDAGGMGLGRGSVHHGSHQAFIAAAGRSTRKQAPPPGAGSWWRKPPCSSTMR
jgi:hypothetical protein